MGRLMLYHSPLFWNFREKLAECSFFESLQVPFLCLKELVSWRERERERERIGIGTRRDKERQYSQMYLLLHYDYVYSR